jgi:hypothetical protein
MQKYQLQYVENLKEIASLTDLYSYQTKDFDDWYQHQLEARSRISDLKKENIRILNDSFFPVLDDLHNASKEDIQDLEAFADQLLDWQSNLDCGIYIQIHDALLSLARIRKDRNGIIKELYKLGMGHYYQNRMMEGMEPERIRRYQFENEMIFTEGGSYLKFFEEIEDEQTKGFIIRSLANIAITAFDRKKRIAISSRILKILQDENYRKMAPGLPWDIFLRRSYQQMSANRDVLSKGNLSKEELTEILEACQIVFEPEKDNEKPNIRWLWPYYEMEYSCGFVDLQTTMNRMEQLISDTPYDQYDDSGLYGNVQLAVYYGRLMRDNPSLQKKQRYVSFLNEAYKKMMKTMLSFPLKNYRDYFRYNIALISTSYPEIEGVDSYEKIISQLIRKLSGVSYVKFLRVGEIMKLYCETIHEHEKDFFDDIPFLKAIEDPKRKKEALLEYAQKCGLYYNFGLLTMNMDRLRASRNLFEREYEIYKMHTSYGYDMLRARESTRIYADIAFGHHRYYNEAGGFPEEYIRNDSDYRKMTDVLSLAVYLADSYQGNYAQLLSEIFKEEGKRFSPMVSSYLNLEELKDQIQAILEKDDKEYFIQLYQQLI